MRKLIPHKSVNSLHTHLGISGLPVQVQDMSLATCYRYATDLCQAISLRYKDYRKLHQKQAIEQGISEVRRLAPQIYAQGINPTVKKIRRFMTHPETLWYPEVVEALTEVRCSLKD